MFQFGWYFNAYPLNFSFFSNLFYLLLLYPLPAILLYSLHFLCPFFLLLSFSLSLSACNEVQQTKAFLYSTLLFVCTWVTAPTRSPLLPLAHRSDSITGIWVNALYALRCRSKGPQRAGLRPQNWRKQQQQQQATSPLGFDLWMCRWIAGALWPS